MSCYTEDRKSHRKLLIEGDYWKKLTKCRNCRRLTFKNQFARIENKENDWFMKQLLCFYSSLENDLIGDAKAEDSAGAHWKKWRTGGAPWKI